MTSRNQLDSTCSAGFVRCKCCHIPTVYANAFCQPCYTSLTRKSNVCLMCLQDACRKKSGFETSYWYCPACYGKDEMKILIKYPQVYSNGSSDREFPYYQKLGPGLYWIYGYNAEPPMTNRILWWTPTFSEESKFFKIEAVKTELRFFWDKRQVYEKIVFSNKDVVERMSSLDHVSTPPPLLTPQFVLPSEIFKVGNGKDGCMMSSTLMSRGPKSLDIVQVFENCVQKCWGCGLDVEDLKTKYPIWVLKQSRVTSDFAYCHDDLCHARGNERELAYFAALGKCVPDGVLPVTPQLQPTQVKSTRSQKRVRFDLSPSKPTQNVGAVRLPCDNYDFEKQRLYFVSLFDSKQFLG